MPPELAKRSSALTIVGPTAIGVEYSGNVIKAGESKAITITISSEGNLNPLKSIPLTPPSGLKLYEGQAQVKHKIRGGRLLTEKTFTYTAIPLHGGTFRIPAVSVVYFDPASASYKVLTTSDIAFVVEGNPAMPSQQEPQATASSAVSTSGNPNLLPTLPPVPVAPPLSYAEKTRWESISERISIQLALLILAATIAAAAIAALLIAGQRARAPRMKLSQQLGAVHDLSELESYLREWLSQRFPEAPTSATWDELRALIRTRISDTSLALPLAALIDDIELQRYGRGAGASIEDLKSRLSQIITIA
jgi:hypothetical protein